jgi:dihydropteroate synthase
MGVLNVTPDSFSDGGQLLSSSGLLLQDRLLERAAQMVKAGAAILDIGGESTRPGAAPVSLQQELDRVMDAVRVIAPRLDVILSVDTSTPEVMREAAQAGAGLLNDVRAFLP